MIEDLQVIYGALSDGSFIFVPESLAEELAATQEALANAMTWGELAAQLPRPRLGEVRERLALETDPAPEAPFDASEIEGFADGDWPEWPAQGQLDWMPTDAQAHGEVAASLISGDFLRFSETGAGHAAAVLDSQGYVVRRDDDLVQRASGE